VVGHPRDIDAVNTLHRERKVELNVPGGRSSQGNYRRGEDGAIVDGDRVLCSPQQHRPFQNHWLPLLRLVSHFQVAPPEGEL